MNGPFRHRKSPPSDRFLGAPAAATPSSGDELDEDDVFWTCDFSESSHHNNVNNTHSTTTPPNNKPTIPIRRGFSQTASFGILAALPEDETTPQRNSPSLLHQRSSRTMMIPIVPRSAPERLSVPHNQSAPVNVPAMRRGFDDVDGDDGEEEEDGEVMLPPHEMVARSAANSPMLACSVLEGVGRTLKGRDLRQVRNAVLRRTGIID